MLDAADWLPTSSASLSPTLHWTTPTSTHGIAPHAASVQFPLHTSVTLRQCTALFASYDKEQCTHATGALTTDTENITSSIPLAISVATAMQRFQSQLLWCAGKLNYWVNVTDALYNHCWCLKCQTIQYILCYISGSQLNKFNIWRRSGHKK